MRDAYDAMIWNDHHDQFSEYVDGAVKAAGSHLRRAASASAVPGQLLAAVAAVSLTLVTFGASAV